MTVLTNRILIAGTTPNSFNTNWKLRIHALHGFRDAFPSSVVQECAWDEIGHAIVQLKPTLLIWMGGTMLEQFDVIGPSIKCQKHGIKIAFWMHDDPYELDASFRITYVADYIFTSDKASVNHYPPDIPTFHLPLAACPHAHFKNITRRTEPDYFFCGVPFPCREQFFSTIQSFEKKYGGLILGPGWDISKITVAADIAVSNAQVSNYYASALSVVYLGRDIDLANNRYSVKPSTPGPRFFEAAMAGACQVACTNGLEIHEYLDSESEFIFIDSAKEFYPILNQLKSNPLKSILIGKAAQTRALQEHTYKHRAQKLIEAILT